jgi:hypothetical protein
MASDAQWPQSHHTLDGRDADWRTAAYFDAGRDTVYARIAGFRCSAELSYKEMMTSSGDRNTLVYPYASNWRHTIELQLKDLRSLLARLHTPGVGGQFERTHNLAQLWATVRPMVEDTFAAEVSAHELKIVTKLMGQLTALDPDGQELRYHKRTNGTPSLSKHPHIDLTLFHESLVGASAFLDAVAEGVWQHIEYQRDVAREFTP